MISNEITQKFSAVQNINDYSRFISFCFNFYSSKKYYFKTLKEFLSTEVCYGIYCADPLSNFHRTNYFEFYYNFVDPKKSYQTYQMFGSPNRLPETADKAFYLLKQVDQLVFIPPVRVSYVGNGLANAVTVSFNNQRPFSYPSKRKMLKDVIPQIIPQIRCPWNKTEKCALARNLLSKERNIVCYETFIRQELLRKIYFFLFQFSFSNKISQEDIYLIFSNFYNIAEQYSLFKIET